VFCLRKRVNAEPKDKEEGSYVSVTKVQVFCMLNSDRELLPSEANLMKMFYQKD
jgi:hypothetical protein